MNDTVRVFAVWQPMLPTDWAAPASSALRRLSDGRVRQYWDPNHLLATQMKQDARAPQPAQDCCIRSGILWDLAAVYGRGSTWSDQMPTATVFNGPVVDITDAIEDALSVDRSGARSDSTPSPSAESRTKGLLFLTRGRCANTTIMRKRLDDGLKSRDLALGYDLVDQDTLPRLMLGADIRRRRCFTTIETSSGWRYPNHHSRTQRLTDISGRSSVLSSSQGTAQYGDEYREIETLQGCASRRLRESDDGG